MTNTNTTKRFLGFLAFAGVLVALSVPAAVSADSGTPTDPTTTATTTTATTTTTPAPAARPAAVDPPRNPFNDPKNWTNVLNIRTQYGPVCVRKICSYPVLPGAAVTVYNSKGKMIKRAFTNGKGVVSVALPKGKSSVKISHSNWHGHRFNPRTYTVTTPIFTNPQNPYFVLTFCVTGGC